MIIYVGFLCFPYVLIRCLVHAVSILLAILCVGAGGLVLGATSIMRWCDRQTLAIMKEYHGKN